MFKITFNKATAGIKHFLDMARGYHIMNKELLLQRSGDRPKFNRPSNITYRGMKEICKAFIIVIFVLVHSEFCYSQKHEAKQLLERGITEYNKADTINAMKYLMEVLKYASATAEAYFYIGLIKLDSYPGIHTAYFYFDKAIKLGLKTADAFYFRAESNCSQPVSKIDAISAMRDINIALTIDSTYSNAYAFRARIRENAFRDSIDLIKDNKFAAYNGKFDSIKEKDGYLEAFSFRDSIERVFGWNKYDIIPDSINNLKLKDYELAIHFNPQNRIAYYNRGVLKNSMGDVYSACLDFKKAYELENHEKPFGDCEYYKGRKY